MQNILLVQGCFLIADRVIYSLRGLVVVAVLVSGLSLPVSAAEQAPPTVSENNASDDAASDSNDPLEPLNRIIFGFNEVFYKMLLRPVSVLYNGFVPPPVRNAVSNVLDNLDAPIILLNDILQGEPQRAWQTTERFVVNSTIGLGGIMDPAESMLGVPKHKEDFGQTLAVWGVGEGFYMVLPLFGPSSPRDGVGKLLVDGYLDPVNNWANNTNNDELVWTRVGLNAVDDYSAIMDELDQIKKTSIDYYAAVRSMYRQKRNTLINNGVSNDLPPILDLTYDYNQDTLDQENLD